MDQVPGAVQADYAAARPAAQQTGPGLTGHGSRADPLCFPLATGAP